MDRSFAGVGPSTPSQTAWATLALQGARLRSGAAPQIMAAFRNLAITLIRRTGTTQIAAYRQHLRAHPATALRLLVPKTRSA